MNEEPTSIPDEMRAFVLQKCRHEFGHYIVAKALGFGTGNLSFKLDSLDGHHVGSSEVMVQTPTPDVTSILSYLERRILVLYSRAIAEPTLEQGLNERAAQQVLAGGGAEGDLVKIRELVAVHLNISRPDAMDDEARVTAQQELMKRLFQEAMRLVRAEHALISDLAASLAQRVTVLGTGAGLGAKDIDELDCMKRRFIGNTIAS